MRKKIIFFIFLIYSNYAFSNEFIERFHDWHFFKTKINNIANCYLISTPIKSEGNFIKRGEPYFMITESENYVDEISTSSGFKYNDKSNIELSFGEKKFYLLPYDTIAWAIDKSNDIEIIKEMQKDADMQITSSSADNKISIDTYSLIGFAKAYSKFKESCLVKNDQ